MPLSQRELGAWVSGPSTQTRSVLRTGTQRHETLSCFLLANLAGSSEERPLSVHFKCCLNHSHQGSYKWQTIERTEQVRGHSWAFSVGNATGPLFAASSALHCRRPPTGEPDAPGPTGSNKGSSASSTPNLSGKKRAINYFLPNQETSLMAK